MTDNCKLSIDTPHSIQLKADYIKKKGYGGMFNWDEGTDYNGELRNAMFTYLH